MAHRCGGDGESRQKEVPIGMRREVVARQKCTPVVAQENRPHGQTPPTEKQPTHSPPLRPGAYRLGRNVRIGFFRKKLSTNWGSKKLNSTPISTATKKIHERFKELN